jgi:hypothetical protein
MGVTSYSLTGNLMPIVASVYNGNTYNSSTYNGSQQTSTASSSGTLSNTGFDIAIIITIACVITLIAVIARIWKRPKRNTDFNS